MARVAGVLMVIGAVASVAFAFGGGRERGHPSPVARASGALASNSMDGQAILSAAEMGPGDSASGDVTVSNAGDGPGELTLIQHPGSETPGGGGGRLWDRLALDVRRVAGTGGTPGGLVYTGPVSALGSTAVGRFDPGETGTYRFTVSFPHSPGDDAAQLAAISIGYEWAAADAPPDAPPAARVPRRHDCRFGRAGTLEGEVIAGTPRDDRIRARAGDDTIRAAGGPDCVFGGRGNDLIDGGKGADQLRGGYGEDEIRGGPGRDVIRGRQGDDIVDGGGGADFLRGTSGDDVIRARDGYPDRIRCGSGRDVAVVDGLDVADGCERVLGG